MAIDVRSVYLKFSFSNFNRVPTGIEQVPDETHVESYQRKQLREDQESAELLFPVTGRVNTSKFLTDLITGDYIPIRCNWQRRLKDGTRYAAVRILLIHRSFLRPDQRVLSIATVLRQLSELANDNLWRVRAYANARRDTYEQGLEVGCSFNFEACEPLFDRHGNRRTERLDQTRNSEGKKTGALTPIQPNATLRLVDRRFILVP